MKTRHRYSMTDFHGDSETGVFYAAVWHGRIFGTFTNGAVSHSRKPIVHTVRPMNNPYSFVIGHDATYIPRPRTDIHQFPFSIPAMVMKRKKSPVNAGHIGSNSFPNETRKATKHRKTIPDMAISEALWHLSFKVV